MSNLFGKSEEEDFDANLELEESEEEVVEEEVEVEEPDDNCIRCIDGVYSRGGVNYVQGETYYVDDPEFFLSLRRSGSGAKMFERC